MQVWQRPCRECLRVHRLGDLPDITRDLRIAFQVVNELGVRRSILWRSPLCGAEPGAPRQTLMPLGLSTT